MIELTVGRALRLAAERNPGKVALVCGSRRLTHGELNGLGNRIANALLAAGFAKGDRVGVMLPNCPEYVAIAYAAAKSGLVMVPLNYRSLGREIAYHLEDAGARGLIFASAFRGAVEEAKEHMNGLRTIVVGDLVASGSSAEPAVAVSEHDLFYLGYTSGTTGRPKGAMITHRNRSLAYHYWALEYGIGPEDVSLHAGPFHHTAPFGFTLTQLYLGGSVAILPAFDPAEALKTVEAARVTWAFMVPYMYNALLAMSEADRSRHELASLRFFISAASPLPTATKEGLLRAFPSVGLHEFYGATEAGVVTNLRPEDQSRKVRCVGKPIFDMEVKVVTPEGVEAAPGEVGELYIKSPTLFEGYFGAPDKTAEVFQDGWCTLGDLARRDAEGYVYIVDRTKDVIKSGGVNVFPTEIEEVLLLHPAVFEAAVIGVPDDRWGEAVHAIVVRRPGAGVSDEELLAHCRQALAGYKVPKSIEFRDELPRNPAGKVLKRLLREEFWAGRSIKV